MVTDGGSSKRVGIWINWGVGGRGITQHCSPISQSEKD